MSNTLAAGNAQTPGQASQTGQDDNNDELEPGADPGADGDAGDGSDPGDGDAGDGGQGGDGSDGDAGAGQGQGQGAPGARGAGRRSAPERIAELAAERNAAMDYANYWRDQALRGNGGAAAGAGAGAAGAGAGGAPPADDPQPTLADFEFDAVKWAPKHAEWVQREVARKAGEIVDQKLAARDQQREAKVTKETYETRATEFRVAHPDFDTVTNNRTLPITKEMAGHITRSDIGPALYYHLATNPPEAARISRLTPANQALALAKLEGRLETQQQAPAGGGGQGRGNGQQRSGQGNGAGNNRTGAPPPPNPVRTGAGGGTRLEELPLDDYVLQRMKQHRGVQ